MVRAYRLLPALVVLLMASPQVWAEQGVKLTIVKGLSAQGRLSPAWLEALKVKRSAAEIARLAGQSYHLSEPQRRWLALIASRQSLWRQKVVEIGLPFPGITLPPEISIVVGHIGGEDAFTPSNHTIAFDLHKLQQNYGDATLAVNHKRIDRFFSHELTHLYHKAWFVRHPKKASTPFVAALWESLIEGLGNYRSLSDSWLDDKRRLSDKSRAALARLQPIFCQRMQALTRANETQAKILTADLSNGPFRQKWGALTVALWLADDIKGDDSTLAKWVEKGAPGVLELAQRYAGNIPQCQGLSAFLN